MYNNESIFTKENYRNLIDKMFLEETTKNIRYNRKTKWKGDLYEWR